MFAGLDYQRPDMAANKTTAGPSRGQLLHPLRHRLRQRARPHHPCGRCRRTHLSHPTNDPADSGRVVGTRQGTTIPNWERVRTSAAATTPRPRRAREAAPPSSTTTSTTTTVLTPASNADGSPAASATLTPSVTRALHPALSPLICVIMHLASLHKSSNIHTRTPAPTWRCYRRLPCPTNTQASTAISKGSSPPLAISRIGRI